MQHGVEVAARTSCRGVEARPNKLSAFETPLKRRWWPMRDTA
jgi:hypothetical protein